MVKHLQPPLRCRIKNPCACLEFAIVIQKAIRGLLDNDQYRMSFAGLKLSHLICRTVAGCISQNRRENRCWFYFVTIRPTFISICVKKVHFKELHIYNQVMCLKTQTLSLFFFFGLDWWLNDMSCEYFTWGLRAFKGNYILKPKLSMFGVPSQNYQCYLY